MCSRTRSPVDISSLLKWPQAHPEPRQRCVSDIHTGGKPGFVRIDADGGLTLPEFNGNFFFNTRGNFVLNPHAVLRFVDFETSDMLQMAGLAQVILDSTEIAAGPGAERLRRFMPRKVVHRPAGVPLRWGTRPDGPSPSVFRTGAETRRLHGCRVPVGWAEGHVRATALTSHPHDASGPSHTSTSGRRKHLQAHGRLFLRRALRPSPH